MPRQAKYLPLLVFAATALSPGSLPAQQSTVTGEWEAEWSRWDNELRLHLDIRTRIDGDRVHSGSSMDADEFTGDVPQRNATGRIRLQFQLDREAGTFEVYLIPETLRLTNLGSKKVGGSVNFEIDRRTQAIVDTVIEYLGDNPATDEEINKVKSNNTLSLPGRWETASAVLRDIGEIVTYDLPDDYWDTYADNVRNVSSEQIVEAADAVIKPENVIWVVVGDREKIEPRIRELELGEITLLDQEGNELSPMAPN